MRATVTGLDKNTGCGLVMMLPMMAVSMTEFGIPFGIQLVAEFHVPSVGAFQVKVVDCDATGLTPNIKNNENMMTHSVPRRLGDKPMSELYVV